MARFTDAIIHPNVVGAHSIMLVHLERMLLAEKDESESIRRRVLKRTQVVRKNKRRSLWRSAIGVAVLFACVAFCANAQSTFGSIRGTVQDGTGAVIPDAAVTVHSLDQGFTRQIVSDGAGDFVIENLQPGHYSITVERSGFSKAVVSNAQLEATVRIRFESTFTNVLNHTNFAPPSVLQIASTPSATAAAGFGALSAPQTSENAGNRTGQVALRVDF